MSDGDADLQRAIDATYAAADAAPVDDADAGKTYSSDTAGMREAATERRKQREAEEAAAPDPEAVSSAKQELTRRVAEWMGATEGVDLDAPTMPNAERLSVRGAAKGLAAYREMRNRELNEVHGELHLWSLGHTAQNSLGKPVDSILSRARFPIYRRYAPATSGGAYGHASSDESEQSKSLARNRKSCTSVTATKGRYVASTSHLGGDGESPIACPKRLEGTS